MYSACDLLASEYGWTKDQILYETYIDDWLFLSREITKRQIMNRIIDLRISTNPHLGEDAKEFADILMRMKNEAFGEVHNEKDPQKIKELKEIMRQNKLKRRRKK